MDTPPEDVADALLKLTHRVEIMQRKQEQHHGEQRREMDQAVAMLREAADQGHVMAQVCIGDLCTLGHGVARDGRLASM